MKKISYYLKSYILCFDSMEKIYNRKLYISFINYIFLIFFISCIYHFDLPSYISVYRSVEIFFEKFLIELLFSSFFFIPIILFLKIILYKYKYIGNKKIVSIKNLINISTHTLYIPILLDIVFLFIFRNIEITPYIQTTYALSSITISVLINIIYPIILIKKIYNKLNNNNNNKSLNTSSIHYFKIKNFIDDKNTIIIFISSFVFIFLFTILISILNPDNINDTLLSISDISLKKILPEFLNYIKYIYLFIFIVSIIFFTYYKLRKINIKFISHLKLSICFTLSILFIYVFYVFELKLRNSIMISISLLSTQMTSVLLPLLLCALFLYFFLSFYHFVINILNNN